MVSRRTLLGISAAVWLMAGFFVLRFGVLEYPAHFSLITVVLTIVVFIPFSKMFQGIAKKNLVRISQMETDRNHVLEFFPKKTYMVIAVMMTLGIVLRTTPAVPRFFIAFFYVGLGTALFLAGASYVRYFLRFDEYRKDDLAKA